MEQLKFLIEDKNVLALFDYGSVVYGTTTEKSDHDFIMVVKNEIPKPSFANNKYDINVYTKEKFDELIVMHEISVLECLFLDNKNIYKNELDVNFSLNKNTLRHSISAKSSNSWVKAKKKFIVEEDYNPYIGQKSAWHAIRMLDFGIQLATLGKIEDYSCSNKLLNKITSCNSWSEIDENFRFMYNEKSSQFKLVAPK